ncbi:hypothetical protein [Marilutibacter spongiae]|uniref:Transmembrane repetitive protein n=1 Tax=Marilutibacter spongiae TaxID=2025720 RepID=A0A7W3Y5T1_9GAMM|nr:hypothetical protein [Lysobacter spongiae]MBB1060512.1 hypothetical protein [Lysobacter spongiae]
MFSAADLIDAVQRKLRLTHRRAHPPGEFPPGWAQWFEAMREARGQVSGAPAEAMVALLLARQPAPPARGPFRDLGRWQAFKSVLRQDVSNAPAGDRGLRIASGVLSLLLNAFFAVMLLWLLFAPARMEPPAAEGEELVVQVEYVGEGTPEPPGGGPGTPVTEPVETAPPTPSPRPVETPAPRPPATAEVTPVAPAERPPPVLPPVDASTPPPELTAPSSAVVEREVPTPRPPAPTVEQRVMVSEPAPDTTDAVFLPPPTPVVAPTLDAPELVSEQPAVQPRDVPVPEAAPTPPVLEVQAREVVAAPALEGEAMPVQARDVPTPVRRPELNARPAPAIDAPALQASEPVAVRERSIPQPAPREAPSAPDTPTSPSASAPSATAPAPVVASEGAQTPVQPPTAPGATASTAPSAAASGGPRPTPAPGGWPTPARSDDFGASDRNVPGGQRGNDGPGLFNSDGSVRLGEQPGSAAPAQPPGAYTEEITSLDRNGTWLKRPPVGYEPTLFDRYWRPNENLLQEWVRRGIKTVSIPIPGTGKKVECAVSLLALGGACGISDPNLNEQPATARPPPDIPFKPALQDDNGSIRPDDGG